MSIISASTLNLSTSEEISPNRWSIIEQAAHQVREFLYQKKQAFREKTRRMTQANVDKLLHEQSTERNEAAVLYGKALIQAFDVVRAQYSQSKLVDQSIELEGELQKVLQYWSHLTIHHFSSQWAFLGFTPQYFVKVKIETTLEKTMTRWGGERIVTTLTGKIDIVLSERLKRFLAGQINDQGEQISWADIDEQGNWIETV